MSGNRKALGAAPSRTGQDLLSDRATSVLPLLVLLVAFLLRLFRVDQPFVDAASWRESDMATIARNFFDGHRNIFLPAIGWAGPGENYVGYEFQLTTYVTAILYGLFGVHDWVARGTTISFGVLGIFAFHRLVRRIEGQDRAIWPLFSSL